MTEQHPITPPHELVVQWVSLACKYEGNETIDLATQAARWGSDQELEACLQWFSEFYCMETWMQKDLKKFRTARRPKPPSLKEQALSVLDDLRAIDATHYNILRNALEQLDDN